MRESVTVAQAISKGKIKLVYLPKISDQIKKAKNYFETAIFQLQYQGRCFYRRYRVLFKARHTVQRWAFVSWGVVLWHGYRFSRRKRAFVPRQHRGDLAHSVFDGRDFRACGFGDGAANWASRHISWRRWFRGCGERYSDPRVFSDGGG